MVGVVVVVVVVRWAMALLRFVLFYIISDSIRERGQLISWRASESSPRASPFDSLKGWLTTAHV